MSSLHLLIIPAIWAVLIGIMFYFRFRDQDDLNPPTTERRRNERRSGAGTQLKERRTQKFDGEDKREQEDRRERQAWQRDFNVLKDKLEEDNPLEP